jgi:hypothetical protein
MKTFAGCNEGSVVGNAVIFSVQFVLCVSLHFHLQPVVWIFFVFWVSMVQTAATYLSAYDIEGCQHFLCTVFG